MTLLIDFYWEKPNTLNSKPMLSKCYWWQAIGKLNNAFIQNKPITQLKKGLATYGNWIGAYRLKHERTYQATYPAIMELQETTSLTGISSNTRLASLIAPQAAYILKRVFPIYRSESKPSLMIIECTAPPSPYIEHWPQAFKTKGYVKLSGLSSTLWSWENSLTDSIEAELLVNVLMIVFQAKRGGVMGTLSKTNLAKSTEIEHAERTNRETISVSWSRAVLKTRDWSWRRWVVVFDRWMRLWIWREIMIVK
jgi:hypothetical protein